MNAALVPRTLLMVLFALGFPAASFAHWEVGVTVGFAPPELPVYAQPPCPAPGYIWTPGYWAYSGDDEDYYWVPGTWVIAASPGLLWTPGYWAAVNDEYSWREGYWAPHVGFYGGINYGFGYFGIGFAGGYWQDRDFYYNRAVTNVTNVNVTNVYNTVIDNRVSDNRTSFNGGEGVRARPTPTELIANREAHRGFTPPQRLQAQSARSVPELRAAVNHGHPSIAATARPGLFHGANVEPARYAGNALANRGPQNAPAHSYTVGRAGEPSRDSAHQPLAAHAATQQAAPRHDRPAWNPPSAGMAQHGVPPSAASSNVSSRRPQMQAPAASWPRPVSYRPQPATPAYQPAPAYAPAPRTPQPAVRNERYAMPAPQSTARNEHYSMPQRAPQSTVSNERYAMPQRAPQTAPRNEAYAMQQRAPAQAPRNEAYAMQQRAPAQAPRNQANFHNAPATRESGPAPMQDRRRPSRN